VEGKVESIKEKNTKKEADLLLVTKKKHSQRNLNDLEAGYRVEIIRGG